MDISQWRYGELETRGYLDSFITYSEDLTIRIIDRSIAKFLINESEKQHKDIGIFIENKFVRFSRPGPAKDIELAISSDYKNFCENHPNTKIGLV